MTIRPRSGTALHCSAAARALARVRMPPSVSRRLPLTCGKDEGQGKFEFLCCRLNCFPFDGFPQCPAACLDVLGRRDEAGDVRETGVVWRQQQPGYLPLLLPVVDAACEAPHALRLPLLPASTHQPSLPPHQPSPPPSPPPPTHLDGVQGGVRAGQQCGQRGGGQLDVIRGANLNLALTPGVGGGRGGCGGLDTLR